MLGLVFSLALVLIDRVLKGLTLRVFSSATFGLLLGLFAATLLRASDVLVLPPARYPVAHQPDALRRVSVIWA